MMSQNNSILCTLDIKDDIIKIISVKDAKIKKRGVIKRIKIVNAKLSYTLHKCPQCGMISLVKNGKRITNSRLASFNGFEYHSVIKKQRFLYRDCRSTCSAHSDLLSKNCKLNIESFPRLRLLIFRLVL
ncbi:transposase family protein [Lactobacillus halodurans]|uniref:Transposase family protein n=1 Tax=Companilactobacillus halodurans TaxID=2584183 RepID=A0A5P0ZZX1_9LACO|nr:transposase family protein [Companilactobacillus halodurans]MQS98435.1 transposase family protein [Companilactobacillus halodurans]